jgi:hypothetical protein
MGTKAKQLTNTPEDVLAYQNELVRLHNFHALGRMQKIAIGPNDAWKPPATDGYIGKYGRLIDLRERMLPIAQSPDGGMVLVLAPMLDRDGRVTLPDLPDPGWRSEPWTTEEVTGAVQRPVEKDTARKIPQLLRDRAEGKLEGSNFLVFSPVLHVTFQPELNQLMQGTIWLIDFRYNPADRTHPTLLIDEQTGETHFYGGLHMISTGAGE